MASHNQKKNPGPYFGIDVGVNYASKSVEELEPMMKEFWQAGVEAVVSITNHPSDSAKNIALSEEVPNFYHTVGCHPHHAKYFKQKARTELADILREHSEGSYPGLVAIGECGLDYFRMLSPKKDQLSAFKFQVGLARQYNLKLYLHCRGSEETPDDAFEDFIQVFKEMGFAEGAQRGIVHCFSGDVRQALSFVQWGFQLGITGMVCNNRRNENLLKVLKWPEIKPEHLLVETDAPYMAIFPKKESSPVDIGKIVRKMAYEMGVKENTLGHALLANARRFIAAEDREDRTD